ncbi:MAG: RNA 2'-phosphotransferase [Pseudomonadota bacterium]
MSQLRSLIQLSKLIAYALGRKPDEFGLVPDADGFIKIKELLKVIHEEDGLKYVRRAHLEEILITQPNPPIEIKGNLIRATYRDKLPQYTPAQDLPKLLYTCVRRRAYPIVLEKGLFPTTYYRVILSSDRDLAERIGKRIDPMPVLLTVQADKSAQAGTMFYSAGDTLFLTESIHKDCFTGPPLPKQKPAAIKPETSPETSRGYELRKLAGSYLIDLNAKKEHPTAAGRKKKSKDIMWAKDTKGAKRRKLKKQPPPWRQ